jgi:hypothetical protein
VKLQRIKSLRQGFSRRFRRNRNETVSIRIFIILRPFVGNDGKLSQFGHDSFFPNPSSS